VELFAKAFFVLSYLVLAAYVLAAIYLSWRFTGQFTHRRWLRVLLTHVMAMALVLVAVYAFPW
jgi:hypothetical protein